MMENKLEIINPDDEFYYDSQLWEVGIYPGAGAELKTFLVYAPFEQKALEIAVANAEQNAPGLLVNFNDVETLITDNYQDDYKEWLEDNFGDIKSSFYFDDDNMFDFITNYLNYIYVDATEEGASEPYFVTGDNLVIRKVDKEELETKTESKEPRKVQDIIVGGQILDEATINEMMEYCTSIFGTKEECISELKADAKLYAPELEKAIDETSGDIIHIFFIAMKEQSEIDGCDAIIVGTKLDDDSDATVVDKKPFSYNKDVKKVEESNVTSEHVIWDSEFQLDAIDLDDLRQSTYQEYLDEFDSHVEPMDYEQWLDSDDCVAYFDYMWEEMAKQDAYYSEWYEFITDGVSEEEKKDAYEDYVERCKNTVLKPKGFEAWLDDNYDSLSETHWEIMDEDLKSNIVPTIDEQLNEDILIISGYYGSNYPDFAKSGKGGKMFEKGTDELLNYMSNFDRVQITSENGQLGIVLGDHDGTISGVFYTLPDDLKELIKAMGYEEIVRKEHFADEDGNPSTEDIDDIEDYMEDYFYEDLRYGGIDAEDLTKHIELLKPIKQTVTSPSTPNPEGPKTESKLTESVDKDFVDNAYDLIADYVYGESGRDEVEWSEIKDYVYNDVCDDMMSDYNPSKETMEAIKERLIKGGYKVLDESKEIKTESTQDEIYEIAKNTNIKEWYIAEYPDDELGANINDVTFYDLFVALDTHKDVYDVLGVGDSVVRERAFEKLDAILEEPAGYCYDQWLLTESTEKVEESDMRRINAELMNNKDISKKALEWLDSHDDIGIVMSEDNIFWFETPATYTASFSDKDYDMIIAEIKRLYPESEYLHTIKDTVKSILSGFKKTESEELEEDDMLIVVEYWETEEDREYGLGNVYDYYSSNQIEDAIAEGRKLVDEMGYAAVEVYHETDGLTYYLYDSENGEQNFGVEGKMVGLDESKEIKSESVSNVKETIENAIIPELTDYILDEKSLDEKKVDYVETDKVITAEEFDAIVDLIKSEIQNKEDLSNRGELYKDITQKYFKTESEHNHTPEQPGVCPVCGNNELEYLGTELEGNSYGYRWDCDKCETSGYEWYIMNFDEIVSSTDDDTSKEEGICPKCASELEYGSLVPDGMDAYYEVNCIECEFIGKEYYTLKFDGHEIISKKTESNEIESDVKQEFINYCEGKVSNLGELQISYSYGPDTSLYPVELEYDELNISWVDEPIKNAKIVLLDDISSVCGVVSDNKLVAELGEDLAPHYIACEMNFSRISKDLYEMMLEEWDSLHLADNIKAHKENGYSVFTESVAQEPLTESKAGEYAINIYDKTTDEFIRQYDCYPSYDKAEEASKELKLADNEICKLVKVEYDENAEEIGVEIVETLNESDESGTLTFDLHTDLVPILNMNQYNITGDYEVPRDELDALMKKYAEPIITEEIVNVFPSAKVTFGNFDHPKYYRAFSNLNDTLDFTVTVSAEEYEAKKQSVENTDEFATFLKDTFKSYDGFISHMADNLKDFQTQADWKQFVSVLTYFIKPGARQDEFFEELTDYIWGNYPTTDEMDEEDTLNESANTNESIEEQMWTAVCSDDRNFVKNAYNKDLIKPNTRYESGNGKHSFIMGALRNRNYEMVDLLKSFGERILKVEVDEYKNEMAKRTYEDELTKTAMEENKPLIEGAIRYVIYKDSNVVDNCYYSNEQEALDTAKELNADSVSKLTYASEQDADNRELSIDEEEIWTSNNIKADKEALAQEPVQEKLFGASDEVIADSKAKGLYTESKEDWFGIKGAKYIWRGSMSDPQVSYKGYLYNYWDVMEFVGDIMDSEFEVKGELVPDNQDAVLNYMQDNPSVIECALLDLTPDKLDRTIISSLENNYTFDGLIKDLEALRETTDIPDEYIDECIKIANDRKETTDFEDAFDEEENVMEIMDMVEETLNQIPQI